MKTAFDAVAEFEEKIDSFCAFEYEGLKDDVRKIALAGIQLVGLLKDKDIKYEKTPDTHFSIAMCYLVTPIVNGQMEANIYNLISVDHRMAKVLKLAPDLNEVFGDLHETTDNILKKIAPDHWVDFNRSERIKLSPYPKEPRIVNTIHDLIAVLEDVPHKDTPIDSLRINKRSEGYFDIDCFSGEFRGEIVEHPRYTPRELLNECVISSSLNVMMLLTILKNAHTNAFIKDIRLKGADNAIYFYLEEDGIVMHD